MNEIYALVQQKYERLLAHWDGLGNVSAESAPDLTRARLQRSGVMLVAFGPVGQQTAANLVQLPLGGLSIFALQAGDIPALTALTNHPQRQAARVNIVSTPLSMPGLSVTLARHHLLAVAGGRAQIDLLRSLNRDCLRTGTAWTQVAAWSTQLTLGPSIIPGVTACYHCYEQRAKANDSKRDARAAREHFLRQNPNFEFGGQLNAVNRLAAAYISAEITRLLTNHQPPLTLSRIFTYDIVPLYQEQDYIVPLEYCPVCGPAQRAHYTNGHDQLSAAVQRVVHRRRSAAHAAR